MEKYIDYGVAGKIVSVHRCIQPAIYDPKSVLYRIDMEF